MTTVVSSIIVKIPKFRFKVFNLALNFFPLVPAGLRQPLFDGMVRWVTAGLKVNLE